jgi:hypothetical protein
MNNLNYKIGNIIGRVYDPLSGVYTMAKNRSKLEFLMQKYFLFFETHQIRAIIALVQTNLNPDFIFFLGGGGGGTKLVQGRLAERERLSTAKSKTLNRLLMMIWFVKLTCELFLVPQCL